MDPMELSSKYIEAQSQHELEHHTDGDAKQSIQKQSQMLEKIRADQLDQDDIRFLKPVFASIGVDISEHVTPKAKRAWWQRLLGIQL